MEYLDADPFVLFGIDDPLTQQALKQDELVGETGRSFFCQKKLEMVGQIFFFRKQGPCYLWNSGCTIRQCKVKAFRTAKCDSNFLENISSTGFIVETGINDSIVAFDAFLFGVIWQILPAMRYTTPWVPFFLSETSTPCPSSRWVDVFRWFSHS